MGKDKDPNVAKAQQKNKQTVRRRNAAEGKQQEDDKTIKEVLDKTKDEKKEEK